MPYTVLTLNLNEDDEHIVTQEYIIKQYEHLEKGNRLEKKMLKPIYNSKKKKLLACI